MCGCSDLGGLQDTKSGDDGVPLVWVTLKYARSSWVPPQLLASTRDYCGSLLQKQKTKWRAEALHGSIKQVYCYFSNYFAISFKSNVEKVPWKILC